MQLKQRVFKASLWVMGNNVTQHGLRLISNLILTRLLVPDMFGLMSLISAILMGMFMLTDVGLKVNVIQNKRTDINYLNTIWTLGIIRALIIWLLSVLVAIGLFVAQTYHWLPLNTVYSESQLPYIIPIFSLSVVISAFEPTWTAIDSRNLNQARLIKIGIVSQILGILFMITLAWMSQTVWSLVVGSLGTSIARLLIVNFYIKAVRNTFHVDRSALGDIFHFGKWLFLSSLIGFLASTSDQFMLGGYITASQLGVYNIAAVIIGAISQSVSSLLGSVAYPALSETIRNKPYDLKRVYYRFRIPFDSGTLFLTGFFLISGQAIIGILYDSRYEAAGWIIGILSLGLLTIRYNISSQCFMALGHTKVMALLSGIRTVAIFVSLPLGFHYYGFSGAVWALTLSGFATLPVSLYYKKLHGILDVKKELITLPIILIGMAAGWTFNQLVEILMSIWVR